MVNRSTIKFLLILLMLSGLGSCKRHLTVSEFMHEVSQDKHFRQDKNIDPFHLSCTYLPKELLSLKESATSKGFNKVLYEKKLKEFGEAAYFRLKVELSNGDNIIVNDAGNQQEYAQKIAHLNYNMEKDLYILKENGERAFPVIYTFLNSYGMTPSADFLYTFPAAVMNTSKDSIEVVYTDKVFGLGIPVAFHFSTKDLKKKLPAIKETE